MLGFSFVSIITVIIHVRRSLFIKPHTHTRANTQCQAQVQSAFKHRPVYLSVLFFHLNVTFHDIDRFIINSK